MTVTVAAFDIYGTLIDNATDEERIGTYEVLSSWLSYQGLLISPVVLWQLYTEKCRNKLLRSPEEYPDIKIEDVFSEIVEAIGEGAAADLKAAIARNLPVLFRVLTTSSIGLATGAEQTLQQLGKSFRLGVISNAQRVFTMPELAYLGITRFFEEIVLSSDVGSSKPGRLIFQRFLQSMQVEPGEVFYIGDNLCNDIFGAQRMGMKAVWINRGVKHPMPPGQPEPVPDAVITSLHDLPGVLSRLR